MTFEDHLSRYAAADWADALETLAPEIHPVDLDATRVWCAFFPLALAKDRLSAQVESSHTFLYGHRYWPQTRRAVLAMAAESSFPEALPEIITRVADHTSRTSSVDRDQLLGIAIAALMTLRQCGLEAFESVKGTVQLPMRIEARSIRQVRRQRAAQRSQGLLGFLRGRKNRFRMTFDENTPGAHFDVAAGQNVASGLPAGASVIGVLAGADKLSPIDPSEAKQLKDLGFAQAATAGGAPLIRLASAARPHGDVTFVILT